jgi:hypothetical protein
MLVDYLPIGVGRSIVNPVGGCRLIARFLFANQFGRRLLINCDDRVE